MSVRGNLSSCEPSFSIICALIISLTKYDPCISSKIWRLISFVMTDSVNKAIIILKGFSYHNIKRSNLIIFAWNIPSVISTIIVALGSLNLISASRDLRGQTNLLQHKVTPLNFYFLFLSELLLIHIFTSIEKWDWNS